jgi:hypothetical protein
MCGPGAGGRRNFNGAFDLRAAFEYVCGDVPGAQFVCGVCSGGKRRCLADADTPSLNYPCPPSCRLGIAHACPSERVAPDRRK